MQSRWYEFKPATIKLRKNGVSYNYIEHKFRIPRSTLSGWLRNVKISNLQRKRLRSNSKNHLVEARKKAVLWHHAQKEKRINEAKKAAAQTLNKLDLANINILELALAFLYLGEGTKRKVKTSIGSSDPMILKFFLSTIEQIYHLNRKKITCQLYLRADQNPAKIRNYWSKIIKIPLANFRYASIDKRTKGTKTYSYYKGVCSVYCGNVAIQRRLLSLANLFSEKIINKGN